MPKVLISDKLSPPRSTSFAAAASRSTSSPACRPPSCAPSSRPMTVWRSAPPPRSRRELLDAATNLKVVGRAGIGVDNVDVKSATARGVVVMNTPHGNTITTAEHAIAMMFALARQIPEASASTRAGKWEKNRFMGVELTGKTLGLIGCGNIGSIVADRAIGLKMKVIAYDPYLSEKRALDLGVEKVELDTLLAPRRHHHAAHAADRRDAQHPVARGAGEDQQGRAHHQLRPRRAGGRGGAGGCASSRATSPAPRWMCSKPSRPPIRRCSAWTTSSAPRISAPDCSASASAASSISRRGRS